MKKLFGFVLGLAFIGSALNIAQATTYTYTFTPTGLSTMDGLNYYTYGFDWSVPAGQTIVDATLTYNNLYLTTGDPNSTPQFFSTLLNTATVGKTTGYDGDNNAPNPTPGPNVFLFGDATFSTPGSGYATLTYDFASISNAIPTLDSYVADGNWGLGFDPDCYYTDTGITFTITTANGSHSRVPDAASTAMLLGAAFVGLGVLRRKVK